jgi:hypothetical protein
MAAYEASGACDQYALFSKLMLKRHALSRRFL